MKRQTWTPEQCAEYFGHDRKLNRATRDETLEAIRKGVREYQARQKIATLIDSNHD